MVLLNILNFDWLLAVLRVFHRQNRYPNVSPNLPTHVPCPDFPLSCNLLICKAIATAADVP
jgi:hypothetical protein